MFRSASRSSAYMGKTADMILSHRPVLNQGLNVALVNSLFTIVSHHSSSVQPRYTPVFGQPAAGLPVNDARDVHIVVHQEIMRTEIVVGKAYAMFTGVRTLDGIDPARLKVKFFDGRNLN